MRVPTGRTPCYRRGCFSGRRASGEPESAERFPMSTKVCINHKCPAYAHLVYTVAMRCVLCRCDLTAAQRNTHIGTGFAGAEAGSAGKSGRAQVAR
jgi:hypothetical protein